jgi:hypothetical protein
MTYRGSIHKGVVVFDEPVPLEDGTVVEVEPVAETARPRRGSAEAILQANIRWAGPPEEVERLLEEVQQMRDEYLTPRCANGGAAYGMA